MNKEILQNDMKGFLDEQKWSTHLADLSQDIYFYSPSNPWTYSCEKPQLKLTSKVKPENNRSQAILEIGYYLN